MWLTDLKISVELIPVWLLLLYISYRLVKANKDKKKIV
jgi:aromatic amino acid transport protein AroP